MGGGILSLARAKPRFVPNDGQTESSQSQLTLTGQHDRYLGHNLAWQERGAGQEYQGSPEAFR
jgi:hypothetical protein